MISLAYASETTIDFDREMLVELHALSEANNRQHGITGYLSWKNGRFFQYLEGPENSVVTLMENIEKDSRHKVLQTLSLGHIDQRRFSYWDMLNMSGVGIPDIRIADLIEDVMNSTIGDVFAEEESRRMIVEMLEQMSKLHRELLSRGSQEVTDKNQSDKPPFVVVFGASAGGLQPLQNVVRSLNSRTDASFIIIQHFSPSTQTVMDMILQRETKMKVCAAANDMKIEPGCIYVIPPGDNLEVSHGRFALVKQQRTSREPQYPIDICFRSVAREYGDRAIAVVLSGTGSDGSRGAKVLNEAGGIVLAQLPKTAEFDGMPNASIDSGMVHQVLAPVDIADFINNVDIEYVHESLALLPERREKYVQNIVTMLADDDVDFTQYKSETLFRRIERRRVLAGISSTDEFMLHIEGSESERNRLRDDILITVTSFFRDPEAWDNLKQTVAPILKEMKQGEVFRVWITACSSGEEAYTTAMILTELIESLEINVNFKIYATDIERKALDIASTGCYAERALENVGLERRKRFFTPRLDGYMIVREIREHVIFAPHNFIKNAPFTRMHLVSCRNVLIYMQPELQQIAIKMLHFALNVNGILFLGPSETLGPLQSEFFPVHREWNQYKKLRNLRLPLHLTSERIKDASRKPATEAEPLQLKHDADVTNIVGMSLDVLARQSGNTNVLIDKNRAIMMVISDPSGLLQMRRGEPSLDIVKMMPESLRPSMTFAINQVFKEHKPVVHKMLPCQPIGQIERLVNVEVVPHFTQDETVSQSALVVIADTKEVVSVSVETQDDANKDLIEALRSELEQTKKALQVAINDLESSNDGQRAINEQLSAANEELQSTNEELQSVNEELYTVNFEYQTKIHELSDLNQDLDNLLDSTNLGVIFLDSDLNIRRFTDFATQTVNLLPSDIGRPFVDLAHNLPYDSLMTDMRRVLSIGKSTSREIARDDSALLQVGIHPYRAGKGLAQGVLITFRDIKTRSAPNPVAEDLNTAH